MKIYLFSAILGLSCHTLTLFSCSERWLVLVVVCGLLMRWLLLWSTDSGAVTLNSYGARAKLLHCMWVLPRPGAKPMSPALAGRFLTTKVPQNNFIYLFIYLFLAMLGLCCFKGFSVVLYRGGYSVVAVCGLLILVHRL